jgi:hypothetical protein
LSQLVAAALFVERANLASIGRALSGPAKHQIKKVCRFIANSRIEPADAMRGVVCHLLRHRSPRKPGKPLVVSLDWTDIKAFSTLTASAVFKGRSVPICWASCLKHVYEGHRSRNAFEESLLRVVRTMIPPYVKVILVADRGFGRTELARFCQHQGFDYVIRIQPNVHVRCECYRGKLIDYPVRPGVCRLLRSVAYRSHHQVIQHIVVRWVRNLPQERDECWFLMTSLRCGPAVISRLYATRMTIEQLFRDVKNKRNGWSLRDTKITRADRLDRLLLILALSYILLCGLGLLLLATRHPGEWSSSSRNDCSVFTIGRIMVHRVHLPIPQLIRRLQTSLAWLDGNWG